MRNKRRKGSRNSVTAYPILIGLLIITLNSIGRNGHSSFFYDSLTFYRDTLPPKTDSLPLKKDSIPPISDSSNHPGLDSLRGGGDSLSRFAKIDTINLKISRDSMDAPVDYKAEDSMVLDAKTRKIILYGRGEMKYKDMNLTAPYTEFDQATQIVTAHMTKDTAGVVVGMAKLVQGASTTVSDSIKFNFKNQKGLTQATYFQEAELFNFAEKVKKIDSSVFYAWRTRFTTCNLDTPHFAFRANKIKFINNKMAITGPVHPEFEGVPVPIYLPFGIFPIARGRHSGILPPVLTVTESYGLGLENFGYYKVINDYFDITTRADVYSYGSWRLNINPTYRVRYKYNGSLAFSYQNTKLNFKGDPDYSENKSWFLNWSHRLDSKARPGVSFSASVNAGSSKYNQYVPNNPTVNFTNQLSSSITYQKSWQGKPYNVSVSLNHNQNTKLRVVNLTIPDVMFNLNQIYPLQPKDMIGIPKWYQKLGIAYNGNMRGYLSFYDTAFQFHNLIDTFQWGANHNLPITLPLPPLGPLQFAPSISYQERWYSQQFIRTWDGTKGKMDTTINKGFYRAQNVTMGVSLSTALFGTAQFGKNSRVIAIRHTMRPSIGVNYKPDLMKPYYYYTQVDTTGRRLPFSVFDGSIYGPFPQGRFGGIGFGLDNNLEMKWRSKKDTGENAIKKVKLIDGFGFNGGYNLLADSFQLSNISFYARSNLFNKVNITANATMDPYQYDPKTGFRVNKFAWNADKFSLGRITSGGLSMSTRFESKKKDQDKKSLQEQQHEIQNYDNLTQDQMQLQMDYIRRNPAEFADFNIPWSVSLNYSLNFSQFYKSDYSGFTTEFTSNISVNGDFNLTEKWKVGANGYYDFSTHKIQTLNMFISREMHCWQLSINVTPVGLYRSFNIAIHPKAGLLRDLRVNRTRYFYGQ